MARQISFQQQRQQLRDLGVGVTMTKVISDICYAWATVARWRLWTCEPKPGFQLPKRISMYHKAGALRGDTLDAWRARGAHDTQPI